MPSMVTSLNMALGFHIELLGYLTSIKFIAQETHLMTGFCPLKMPKQAN